LSIYYRVTVIVKSKEEDEIEDIAADFEDKKIGGNKVVEVESIEETTDFEDDEEDEEDEELLSSY
jgi:hypothetical protein